MTQSLAKIVVHAVYSTKNREPLLIQAVRDDLYAYIVGILDSLDCAVLEINGTEDHVHALILMSRTISSSKMIEEMKKGSSRWLKTQNAMLKDFAWQGGYSVFSVSESQVPKVVQYIQNQEERHKKMSFQDEFRNLLIKHNIEFDEKYLWS